MTCHIVSNTHNLASNCVQYLRDEIAAVGACVRFLKMAKNGKNPPWPSTAFPRTSMRLRILVRNIRTLDLVTDDFCMPPQPEPAPEPSQPHAAASEPDQPRAAASEPSQPRAAVSEPADVVMAPGDAEPCDEPVPVSQTPPRTRDVAPPSEAGAA